MNHDVGGWTHLGPELLAHAQPWKTSPVRSAPNGEFSSFLEQDSQLPTPSLGRSRAGKQELRFCRLSGPLAPAKLSCEGTEAGGGQVE